MDDKIVSQASSSTSFTENAAVKAVPVSDDEEDNANENEQEFEQPITEDVLSPREIDTDIISPKEIEPEAISPNETAATLIIENGNGILNNYSGKSPSPTEITPPPSVEPLVTQTNFNLEIDEYSIAHEMNQVLLEFF